MRQCHTFHNTARMQTLPLITGEAHSCRRRSGPELKAWKHCSTPIATNVFETMTVVVEWIERSRRQNEEKEIPVFLLT